MVEYYDTNLVTKLWVTTNNSGLLIQQLKGQTVLIGVVNASWIMLWQCLLYYFIVIKQCINIFLHCFIVFSKHKKH
jgi:hypothetical protein